MNIQAPILIIALAAAILILHLVLAGVIARRFSQWSSLLALGALALLSTVAWLVIATLLFFNLTYNPPPDATLASAAYHATFGWLIRPCDWVPPLDSLLGSDFCVQGVFIIGPIVFFLLGLLPILLVKRRASKPHA